VNRALAAEAFADSWIRGCHPQNRRPVFFWAWLLGDAPEAWEDVVVELAIPGNILDNIDEELW